MSERIDIISAGLCALLANTLLIATAVIWWVLA